MRAPHRSAGIVAVWVVLIIMVLIGILGLVCDLAYVHLIGQQLQVTADAAALGGAQYVHLGTFSQAHDQAKMVALANLAASNNVALFDGDVQVGRWYQQTGQFVETEEGADAVRVVARRPDAAGHTAPLFWGPLFGTSVAHGGRAAVALNLGLPGGAIVVLDPKAPQALRIDGHGESVKISIDNGRLHVNSTSLDAIKTGGNPVLEIPDVSVCAPYPPSAEPTGSGLTGNFWPKAPYVPDPLAWLQAYMDAYLKANPLSQMPPLTAGPGTLGPGYYPNGIDVNGSVNLQPGMYLLGGSGKRGGLQVHGSLVGHEVYIYVIGGVIDLTGSTTVDLTAVPMGPGAPPYAGVVLHQAITNSNDSKITGNEITQIEDNTYLPMAQLWLGGNCNFTNSQLIVNMLRVDGTASLRVHYDGRFGGNGTVFLVK